MKLQVFLISVLMLSSTSFQAQTQSREDVMKQFVGTWRFESTEQRLADGTARPSPTQAPGTVGYFIFTDTNRLCVEINNANRAKWASANAPTEREVKATMDGLTAYCDTYDVDVAKGMVTFHIEVDKIQNAVGTDRIRFYVFSGNRLMLHTPPSFPQGVVDNTITWQRVEK